MGTNNTFFCFHSNKFFSFVLRHHYGFLYGSMLIELTNLFNFVLSSKFHPSNFLPFHDPNQFVNHIHSSQPATSNCKSTNRMGVGAIATVLPPARSADALDLRARAACDLLPELRVRVQAVDVGVLGHVAAQDLSKER